MDCQRCVEAPAAHRHRVTRADHGGDLGCTVGPIDNVFGKDPADSWTAEFYAGVGTRLRSIIENEPDLPDPGVAIVLQAALNQEMRKYYSKVLERYGLRDKLRAFFDRYVILLSPALPITSLNVDKDIRDELRDRTWCLGSTTRIHSI
jgi:aspartyl-tRNA(Asn)/glutamyl-tRNA(Gln) amidotransferase subunit A